MTVLWALSEPLAHSPLVLSKQYATELGEAVGWNMFGCRRGRTADGEGIPRPGRSVASLLSSPQGRDWVTGSAAYLKPSRNQPLLRLGLDPDVEVDALAVDDDLTLADVGLRNDPVTQHHVPLERNLERELDSCASAREVEPGVVSARHQGSSSTAVRRA